ncbi:MAG: hypothetical protein O2931_04365 [Planctomycetota bacterium]|nr:hypothetical protein [Planctomycetota bacterium]MDA1178015.1 hypothetical protein [Planctomycetota bacterium]
MSLHVPFHKYRGRLSLFLQLTLLWCATPTLAEPTSDSPDSAPPKKIAAIVTTYFPNSHAGVLVDKFLRGFPTDDGVVPPRMTIASLYIDQIHEQDIGRQVAKQFDVPLYESIRDALTLGGETLAVDAVLLIGEHGNYPKSKLGQEMLPRRYFFEQILGVIGESHRAIPVFNDKFLAYRWDDAHWMYETSKSMHVPLWAGSSLPVVWRSPNWEHPAETPISEALVLGMHMVERYGFHALEILQSQVERRTGGESGVRSVQCLSGDAVWQAGQEGRWSETLANAALHSIQDGPQHLDPSQIDDPHVFLIEYCDGLRAAVLMLGDGFLKSFAYAETSQSAAPTALEYISATGPANAAFSYLGLNIEDFFLTQSPPSALERTLLTTGILEAALISRHQNGARIETPHLEKIQYKPFGNPRRPQATHPSNASTAEWNVLEPGKTPAAESIPIVRNGTVRGPRANRN